MGGVEVRVAGRRHRVPGTGSVRDTLEDLGRVVVVASVARSRVPRHCKDLAGWQSYKGRIPASPSVRGVTSGGNRRLRAKTKIVQPRPGQLIRIEGQVARLPGAWCLWIPDPPLKKKSSTFPS